MISFEDRYESIVREIEKRRYKWRFTRLSFDDASQIILTKIFVKYYQYDERKGEFTHWLNKVISSALKNILRDNLTKFSRPCILKCPFNLGDNHCSYTKSGKQCEECPLFASWKKRKENHFNVQQSLPLESHIQEVHSIAGDFVDIESAKVEIDKEMKKRLKSSEFTIYKMLYIDNMEPEDVGRILKYKKAKNSSIPGYQIQLKLKKKFVELASLIIQEKGLA